MAAYGCRSGTRAASLLSALVQFRWGTEGALSEGEGVEWTLSEGEGVERTLAELEAHERRRHAVVLLGLGLGLGLGL